MPIQTQVFVCQTHPYEITIAQRNCELLLYTYSDSSIHIQTDFSSGKQMCSLDVSAHLPPYVFCRLTSMCSPIENSTCGVIYLSGCSTFLGFYLTECYTIGMFYFRSVLPSWCYTSNDSNFGEFHRRSVTFGVSYPSGRSTFNVFYLRGVIH